MNIESEDENGVIICHVDGRIDTNTASTFEQGITTRLSEQQRLMVLDMRGVYYVSSAGLRAVLIIAKQAQAINCSLRIAALNDDVKKVFEVTGFHTVVPIFADVATALDASG